MTRLSQEEPRPLTWTSEGHPCCGCQCTSGKSTTRFRSYSTDISSNIMARPSKKRQRNQVVRTRYLASPSSSRLWSTAILFATLQGTQHAQAQSIVPTFSQCTTYLALSDENRDGVLVPEEYVGFLNYMSSYYFRDFSYEQLPLELTTNFEVPDCS